MLSWEQIKARYRVKGIPASARNILAMIPRDFKDDGCSHAPDTLLGRSIKWACEIHDWRCCTRCHAAGSLTQSACNYAAQELGVHVRYMLPFSLRWIGWLYYRATYRFTELYWDSCGPEVGELCRHNMPKPDWM